MNDVAVPLDDDIARAVILAVAHSCNGYNKAWAWWAIDADENKVYKWGNAKIILVQNTRNTVEDDSYGGYSTAEVELVWQISVDEEEEVRFFRIKGEFSSYGGDEWSETSFREVKPTSRVYREYI